MRIFGWVLGGLLLADGLFALMGKRGFVKMVTNSAGKKLPHGMEKTLKRATKVNDTTMKAMGINNLIAGVGLVLVSSLAGGETLVYEA